MTDYQTEKPDSGHDAPESLYNASPTLDGTPQTPSAGLPQFSLLFVGLTFVAALFLGATIGFGLGRSQSQPAEAVVVTATTAEAVAQTGNNSAQSAEQPDSAANQPTPTIMDFVLSDARHFQGSTNAPITMVEFSDFK